MRITNLMLGQSLLRNLETAQNRMDEYQNQLSSGHRIFRPSDDPVGVETALRLKSTLSAVKQWQANAQEGQAFLRTTDSALGEIMDMLQRTRELTVQGATGTLSAEDRKKMGYEAQQINEQVGVVANTKLGSKYLFGGTNTIKPWDGTTWTGNNGAIKFEVGSGSTVQINLDVTSLFDGGIFNVIGKLKNDLDNNDQQALESDLEDIDAQINAVMAKRAEAGARSNRLETIEQQLDSTTTNLTKNLSEVQDVDVAKVVVALNNQENVYRAALSVGARIIQPSLVDFMR